MVSRTFFQQCWICWYTFWLCISNQVDPNASINNLRQCQWEQKSRNYWIAHHGNFQFSIDKTRKWANYPLRSSAYLYVPNWQRGFSKTKNEAWIWLIISASTTLDIQQLKEEEEEEKKIKWGMIKERAAEQNWIITTNWMYMTKLGLQSNRCPHNFKLILYHKEFGTQEE